MKLFNLLELMDGNENILVVRGHETVYHGLVDNVPLSVFRQDVVHQGFYSDGGTFLGIRFELPLDEGEYDNE